MWSDLKSIRLHESEGFFLCWNKKTMFPIVIKSWTMRHKNGTWNAKWNDFNHDAKKMITYKSPSWLPPLNPSVAIVNAILNFELLIKTPSSIP
jgi:hypothetical protein